MAGTPYLLPGAGVIDRLYELAGETDATTRARHANATTLVIAATGAASGFGAILAQPLVDLIGPVATVLIAVGLLCALGWSTVFQLGNACPLGQFIGGSCFVATFGVFVAIGGSIEVQMSDGELGDRIQAKAMSVYAMVGEKNGDAADKIAGGTQYVFDGLRRGDASPDARAQALNWLHQLERCLTEYDDEVTIVAPGVFTCD